MKERKPSGGTGWGENSILDFLVCKRTGGEYLVTETGDCQVQVAKGGRSSKNVQDCKEGDLLDVEECGFKNGRGRSAVEESQ